jgi:hypothetical protein
MKEILFLSLVTETRGVSGDANDEERTHFTNYAAKLSRFFTHLLLERS